MKNYSPCPGKKEILNWINDYVQKDLGNVRKIQDLGNCSAYLYMINAIKPGMIKLDKVYKNPIHSHEISSNIKLLMLALEKLNLDFKIEADKLASMKFQQNFHLAVFMYQTFKNNENRQQNLNVRQTGTNKPQENLQSSREEKKMYKVIVPAKPKPMILTKDEHQDDSFQNLPQILKGPPRSRKHFDEIQGILQESHGTDRQKLSKIAKILNMKYNKAENFQEKLKKSMTVTPNEKLTMQAAYRSYIRPSLTRDSKFLNSDVSKNEQKMARVTQHEEKDESGMDRMTKQRQESRQKETYANKYEEDLLHSHKNEQKVHQNEFKNEEMGLGDLLHSDRKEQKVFQNEGHVQMGFNVMIALESNEISQECDYQ